LVDPAEVVEGIRRAARVAAGRASNTPNLPLSG